jgi:hypothetical protein
MSMASSSLLMVSFIQSMASIWGGGEGGASTQSRHSRGAYYRTACCAHYSRTQAKLRCSCLHASVCRNALLTCIPSQGIRASPPPENRNRPGPSMHCMSHLLPPEALGLHRGPLPGAPHLPLSSLQATLQQAQASSTCCKRNCWGSQWELPAPVTAQLTAVANTLVFLRMVTRFAASTRS